MAQLINAAMVADSASRVMMTLAERAKLADGVLMTTAERSKLAGGVLMTTAEHARLSSFIPSAKELGAAIDGVTDDAPAINAAISALPAGSGLFLPPGNYVLGSTVNLSKPGLYFGAGYGTHFICNFADGPVFDLTGGYVSLRDFRLTHAVPRSNGAISVRVRQGNSRVSDFHIDGFAVGLTVEATSCSIERGTLWDGKPVQGIGILVNNGPFDVSISDILLNGASNIHAGTRIMSTGDVSLSKLQLIHCDYGLDILALDGAAIASVWAIDSFFDNCGINGVRIYADGAGSSIVRPKFTHCWFSSAGQDGAWIGAANSGLVGGALFTASEFLLCALNGAFVGGGATGATFNGNIFSQNLNGLWFDNGVNDFMVTANRIGPYSGLAGNTNNGVVVSGTSHDDYMIVNNNLRGNGNHMVDSGLGPNKIVAPNLI